MYALFFCLMLSCAISLLAPAVYVVETMTENKANAYAHALLKWRSDILNQFCAESNTSSVEKNVLENWFDYRLDDHFVHWYTKNQKGREIVQSILTTNISLQVAQVDSAGNINYISPKRLTDFVVTEELKSSVVLTLPIDLLCRNTKESSQFVFNWGTLQLNKCAFVDLEGHFWQFKSDALYRDLRKINATQFIIKGMAIENGHFYFDDGNHFVLQEKSIVLNGMTYVCNYKK